MSPLLGALGDSSEYAYRGNLDDFPTDFNFTNIPGAEPGIAYTTGPITISGINNKVQVSVSSGSSIAVNSGIFTSGPTFVRSGDTISIYRPTTQGTDADFSKTYRTTVTIGGGKFFKEWVVTTRDKDSSPTPFTFTSISNQELGIAATSNTITVSGLEPTVSSVASIVSGVGSFSKNGGPTGTASTIGNGDTIFIASAGPTDYSKTNTTVLSVGNYSTSYSISTRDADTTVDQFVFNNFVNVAISSSFDSNSITLSGADVDTVPAPVPLTATVTGGFLKVERGSSTVRDFSTDPAIVYNGDVLTLSLNSSVDYSSTTSATLSITGVNTPVGIASTFSVTTRPNISDTIVDQFQFVDKDRQNRNVLVISDPIVISGITTGADDFSNIFLTNNADGGEYRITRNGNVVSGFTTESGLVRSGDIVELRIKTSPASEGTVLTNVSIAGTDNSDINNILRQTRTDTWVVKSARRECPLSIPTLATVNGVEPATLQSVTFTPTSYDADCNVVVNTSNSNSYLDVNGTIGNDLVVLPGVACTVYMTSGTFSEIRTTTIKLTANNNVPTPIDTTAKWSVVTRASNDPTVTISVSPSSITCGGESTLTWSTTNTVSLVTEGFSGVSTAGGLTVNPRTTTTYKITATGPDNTTRTGSATLLVNTTAQASILASDTLVEYNGSVTLAWGTSNASSVISNFGTTLTSGQITLTGLRQSKTYTVEAVSNSGCGNSPPASVTVNVEPCEEITDSDRSYGNFTLNYIYADAGNGFAYYYTSASGLGLNSLARDTSSTSEQFATTTPSGQNGPLGWGQCGSSTNNCSNNYVNYNLASWTVPAGVTSITITLGGAGGGGAGGGGLYDGGDGGSGGEAIRDWPVVPGAKILYAIGFGGKGSPGCGDGGTYSAGPGYSSWAWYNSQDPNNTNTNLIAWAEGGGGGFRSVTSGPVDGADGRASGGSTGNTVGGGSAGGAGGSTSSSNPCNSNATAGSSGGNGYIVIDYEITGTSETWSALINGINDQYRASFNRPPTVSEMDYWIGQYINSTTTVASIKSSISTSRAYKSFTGAISSCFTTL